MMYNFCLHIQIVHVIILYSILYYTILYIQVTYMSNILCLRLNIYTAILNGVTNRYMYIFSSELLLPPRDDEFDQVTVLYTCLITE